MKQPTRRDASRERKPRSPSATDVLKKQHKEVKDLFKKVENADDAATRRQLLDQVSRAVQVHTRIEEEIFYPAVREVPTKKAEEMVLEALEEHHVVDLVVAELPQVDPENERFEAKMTVLKELVTHHADEEEDEMFRIAEKLGKEELARLGEELQSRAEQLKGEGRRAA